jgi:hypothetical protein
VQQDGGGFFTQNSFELKKKDNQMVSNNFLSHCRIRVNSASNVTMKMGPEITFKRNGSRSVLDVEGEYLFHKGQS